MKERSALRGGGPKARGEEGKKEGRRGEQGARRGVPGGGGRSARLRTSSCR